MIGPSGPQPPLLGPRELREMLDFHGVRLTKVLGQNFVIDPNTIRKVVEVARVGAEDHVLEIGAGVGSLTRGLAAVAKTVTAVEVDERLIPILETTLAKVPNCRIVHADALQMPLAEAGASAVVANLPYNVATAIVFRVLEEAPEVRRLTVMAQREVGERLAAPPGDKVYGQSSVMATYYAYVEVAGRVSRRAFFPEPNVDSVIVGLTRRGSVDRAEAARLREVVRAAFQQRRKTLRNSLGVLAGSPGAAEEALRSCGIEPDRRAEEIGVQDFLRLANLFGYRLPTS